jgi:hypothetical protein
MTRLSAPAVLGVVEDDVEVVVAPVFALVVVVVVDEVVVEDVGLLEHKPDWQQAPQ